ncbi:PRCC domain-containing protein [Aspergillus affinis]|uniref:PRCC domain-containing protein n=1 Tax=Aspergillus affinis TaxID=1070780 RepID=UPI0022FE0748|nr:uncharacterized protein KD926_004936 [Aspergillus affinis]KAI9042870.1 hypothetical protein KD926_004936 [Aspergillus affinis]
MALVSYSDSENSDSEPGTPVVPQPKTQKPAPAQQQLSSAPSTGAKPPSIVDRSNPRKIRVALPEIKPEKPTDADAGDDGPARKRPRIGGGASGGGLFSGFNSFLPAPKKNTATAAAEKEKNKKTAAPARKVFSLKTGAAPGFDREADAEMRRDQALGLGTGDFDDDETIPKAGSLGTEEAGESQNTAGDNGEEGVKEKPVEVKLKGNPMMFKPLSVGRTQQKKKKAPPKTTTTTATATNTNTGSLPAADGPKEQAPLAQPTPPPAAAPKPKPKVSLFSLSSAELDAAAAPSAQTTSATYEPLVYSAPSEAPAAGPSAPEPQESQATGPAETLDNIADDLNLSRAQRRQLFGRNAESSKSRVLHFNTDKEYIANQEAAHNTDLAAVQHNPVRPIAPGKHSLQQLVNAASNQREALEESFASGRRNKQEAGSKYGW